MRSFLLGASVLLVSLSTFLCACSGASDDSGQDTGASAASTSSLKTGSFRNEAKKATLTISKATSSKVTFRLKRGDDEGSQAKADFEGNVATFDNDSDCHISMTFGDKSVTLEQPEGAACSAFGGQDGYDFSGEYAAAVSP